MSIVQAVLTHIVLTKRKVVLDQFREGLKLLVGFGSNNNTSKAI